MNTYCVLCLRSFGESVERPICQYCQDELSQMTPSERMEVCLKAARLLDSREWSDQIEAALEGVAHLLDFIKENWPEGSEDRDDGDWWKRGG